MPTSEPHPLQVVSISGDYLSTSLMVETTPPKSMKIKDEATPSPLQVNSTSEEALSASILVETTTKLMEHQNAVPAGLQRQSSSDSSGMIPLLRKRFGKKSHKSFYKKQPRTPPKSLQQKLGVHCRQVGRLQLPVLDSEADSSPPKQQKKLLRLHMRRRRTFQEVFGKLQPGSLLQDSPAESPPQRRMRLRLDCSPIVA